MSTEARRESEEQQETEKERRMRDERFVEKFFTERELGVKYDKTGDSDEIKAQRWYKAVEKTVSTLPIYQHDNVGQPLPNTDTSEADSTNVNKTDTLTPEDETTHPKTTPHAWFFRGQKDARFAFTSTLYRRLSDQAHYETSDTAPHKQQYLERLMCSIEEQAGLETPMINAEIELLNKAREIGIGRGLTALETLTLLQHHGSPTRLIDVTSDWRVALYFACESDQDRDGRIFLIRINPDDWKLFPRENSKAEQAKHLIWEHFSNIDEYESLLCDSVLWGIRTWPILLPFSDPRMISQRGFFLVGGIPIDKFANKLLTSRCPDCNHNRCKCPDRKAEQQSITDRKEDSRSLNSQLTGNELRKITSLSIVFEANRAFPSRATNTQSLEGDTVGYSMRVPKEYKRTLIDILYREGVHTDSIYPPLRETVRLFEHVVDESLKQ